MKIKKIHITAFGKLKNVSYDFTSGLNQIIKPNGEGKSSIVDFLKAMFYGLDSDRSNGSFNDRRHYSPFDGSKIHGVVELEVKGKEYYLERSFDSKSVSGDVIIFKENNTLLDEKNPGQYLLNIDKETYEKLLHITTSEIQIQVNSDLKSKLSNPSFELEDDYNLDEVLKTLASQVRDYEKKIKNINQDISLLDNNIFNLPSLENSLDDLKNNLNTKQEELTNLNNILSNYDNYKEVSIKLEILKEKERSLENLKTNLINLENKYPLGYFSNEESELIKLNNSQITKLNNFNTLNSEVVKIFKDKELKDINDLSSNKSNVPLLLIYFSVVLLLLALLLPLHKNIKYILIFISIISVIVNFFFCLKLATNKEVREILKYYNYPLDDYDASYLKYENDLKIYKEYLNNLEVINNLVNENKKIASKYNLTSNDINEVINDINLINNLKTKEVELAKEIKDYLNLHNLTNKTEALEVNNNLYQTKDNLLIEIEKIKKQIDDLEVKIQIINENQITKLNLLQTKETLQNQKEISKLTSDFLKESLEESIEKHLKPMLDSINKYLSYFDGEELEKIELDRDYKVYYKSNGVSRSYKHLSSGVISLLAFAYRLALISNMFKETKPFIILDDPFVFLDDKNLESIKKLVKEVASESQVIYLSCKTPLTD